MVQEKENAVEMRRPESICHLSILEESLKSRVFSGKCGKHHVHYESGWALAGIL